MLGIDALITREVRNTHKLLYNHIQTIRSDPFLANAMCVLNFESNLAFESQHLLHHLHETGVKNWVSLAEGAHNELGWLTTHSRKEAMALQVREALRVGKLSYYPSFFSVSLGAHEAKKRLGDELRNFSVVTEPGKTHFSKVRARLSRIPTKTLTVVCVCAAASQNLHRQDWRTAGRRLHRLPARHDGDAHLLREPQVRDLCQAVVLEWLIRRYSEGAMGGREARVRS